MTATSMSQLLLAFSAIELFVNLLRAGIARAGADRAHRDTGMLLLEHRTEIVLDVLDHVLVTGGDEVQRHRLLRRDGQGDREPRQCRDDDAEPFHGVPPWPVMRVAATRSAAPDRDAGPSPPERCRSPRRPRAGARRR